MTNGLDTKIDFHSCFNVVACLVIACVSMCCSSEVLAWNFSEHRELGQITYAESCKRLEKAYKDNEGYTALMSFVCLDYEVKSRSYGVMTAIAGDHIKSPDDFDINSVEKQSLSLSNYGILALENYDHFWPRVNSAWKKYHSKAIDIAIDAKKDMDNKLLTKAKIKFERAIKYSAFADHFLQDSFSIGHNGFSRINSLQNDSLIFHDKWNNIGRYLKGNRFNLGDDINAHANDVMYAAVNNPPLTCQNIVDYNNIILKNENMDCHVDIWFALGDGNLNRKENIDNKGRIIRANIYSLTSVIRSFIDGSDKGYSVLADNSFPLAAENFVATSQMASYFSSRPAHTNSYPDPATKQCEDKIGVYEEHELCWFDLNNMLMEPVYPDITFSLGRIYFRRNDVFLTGLYGAYSPHGLIERWPKWIRVYGIKTLDGIDASYSESGVNIVLPNLYDGTPISHEMEFAYASISKDVGISDSINRNGAYLGINTNIDILRVKISLGAGYFLPATDLKESELKVQFTLGWSFGSLGGGPLSRWD